jgi:hypothetical protein
MIVVFKGVLLYWFMDKKVSKVNQGKIQPGIWQYGFIGIQEGEHVIIDVDEKNKGRFIFIKRPETKEDLELVKQYKGE